MAVKLSTQPLALMPAMSSGELTWRLRIATSVYTDLVRFVQNFKSPIVLNLELIRFSEEQPSFSMGWVINRPPDLSPRQPRIYFLNRRCYLARTDTFDPRAQQVPSALVPVLNCQSRTQFPTQLPACLELRSSAVAYGQPEILEECFGPRVPLRVQGHEVPILP